MEMTRHDMTHQLIPFLKRLRLSGILQTLQARNQQAIDGRWTYVEFLARLLEDEVERRAQKQLALRIRRAAINTTKTLEGFDFNFNPSINRQQVLDLASCTYIRQKRNVLICGPTGVGKTHLAQALTHEACRQGYSALFVNTYRMLQHINGGRADGTLERRFQTYLRPDLLVLDDFGLKPLHLIRCASVAYGPRCSGWVVEICELHTDLKSSVASVCQRLRNVY